MQVLVLAVQNSVDHRLMGVATSGGDALPPDRRVDRRRAVRRDLRQPPGCEPRRAAPRRQPAKTADPRTVQHLPPAIHDAYVSAFAASLQPVFVVAAAVGVAAFLLTWLLREMPLRQSTGAAETAGETFGLEEAA